MEGSRIVRDSRRASLGAFLLAGLFVGAVAVEAQVPETVELVAHVEFRGTEDDRIPAEVAVEFLDAATRTPLSSVSVATGSAPIVDLRATVPLTAAGSPWEVVASAEVGGGQRQWCLRTGARWLSFWFPPVRYGLNCGALTAASHC